MVYFHSSISVCNSVDQSPTTTLIMSNSLHSSSKPPRTTRKSHASSPTCSNFPVCDGSQSVAIDVVILIAVITACGFLFFPYVKLITLKSIEFFSDLSVLVKEEILQNPIVDAGSPIVKGLGKLLSLIFSLRLRNASRAPTTTATTVPPRGGCFSCLVSITVNWKPSSRRWHRLMGELSWFSEPGVVVL
ncbi:PREDICTED: uncharacterized protein LOC104703658 isoform X2 [Camelina sativa]|uniref:Uncharacterized protein LOC104703658 isoform X2 n=1 Tax=Camelina sativa TaxID=90675 RepID=A0ABM1RJS7_CAMSA|nr:PREDICTED: uncharacterized protein LOC104703658 isoform X2 [Camelina sativa]